MPNKAQGRPGEGRRPLSDFERFREAQRSYARAKREARLLKEATRRLPAEAGTHPWILASQKAKRVDTDTAQERPAPPRRRTLLAAGAILLSAALYAAARLLGPSGDAAVSGGPPARPFHVWHTAGPAEGAALSRLAAEMLRDGREAVVTFQPDLLAALSAALLAGELPHVLVLPQGDAERLARTGLLAPIGDGEEPRFYLPLSEPPPWAVPLTAAVPALLSAAEDQELSRAFIRRLQRHLGPSADGEEDPPAP